MNRKKKSTLKVVPVYKFLIILAFLIGIIFVLKLSTVTNKKTNLQPPKITKSFDYIFPPKNLKPKIKLYIDYIINNYKNNFYSKISQNNIKQGNLFIYTENLIQDSNTVSFDITFVTDNSKQIIKERRHFVFDNQSQELLINKDIDIPKIKIPQISNIVDCNIEKCVALTFDDGPHTLQTIRLLNELDKYNVKATFFVQGERIGKDPNVLLREFESGHEIGNHTYDHKNITTLTDIEVVEEILKTDNLIYYITETKPNIFRPPYGAINNSEIYLVNKPIIKWTFDLHDWLDSKDPTELLQECENKITPGSIILMHDIRNSTIEAIPLIINSLTKKGYKFVTIANLLGVSNNYSIYNQMQIYSINDRIFK